MKISKVQEVAATRGMPGRSLGRCAREKAQLRSLRFLLVRQAGPLADHLGEPADDLPVLLLGEEAEQLADLLERDLPVERGLAGAINGTDAAGSDGGGGRPSC